MSFTEELQYILEVYNDSIENAVSRIDPDIRERILNDPVYKSSKHIPQNSLTYEILLQVYKDTESSPKLTDDIVVDSIKYIIDCICEQRRTRKNTSSRRATYANNRGGSYRSRVPSQRGVDPLDSLDDDSTIDRRRSNNDNRRRQSRSLFDDDYYDPKPQTEPRKATVEEISKANQQKDTTSWDTYDTGSIPTIRFTDDYKLSKDIADLELGEDVVINNVVGDEDGFDVVIVYCKSDNSFTDAKSKMKYISTKLGSIEKINNSKYIYVEKARKLKTLSGIPTEIFIKVVNAIKPAIMTDSSNHQGITLKLLNEIVRHTIEQGGVYSDAIDEYFGDILQEYVVNRICKLSENIGKTVNIKSLSDLITVLNTEPAFVKDSEFNKAIWNMISSAAFTILRNVLLAEDLIVTKDNYISDILKSDDIQVQTEDGETKFDLALTDSESITDVVDTETVLRIPHGVLLTNLMSPKDLTSMFRLSSLGIVMDCSTMLSDKRAALLMSLSPKFGVMINTAVFEFVYSNNVSTYKEFNIVTPIDKLALDQTKILPSTFIER